MPCFSLHLILSSVHNSILFAEVRSVFLLDKQLVFISMLLLHLSSILPSFLEAFPLFKHIAHQPHLLCQVLLFTILQGFPVTSGTSCHCVARCLIVSIIVCHYYFFLVKRTNVHFPYNSFFLLRVFPRRQSFLFSFDIFTEFALLSLPHSRTFCNPSTNRSTVEKKEAYSTTTLSQERVFRQ